MVSQLPTGIYDFYIACHLVKSNNFFNRAHHLRLCKGTLIMIEFIFIWENLLYQIGVVYLIMLFLLTQLVYSKIDLINFGDIKHVILTVHSRLSHHQYHYHPDLKWVFCIVIITAPDVPSHTWIGPTQVLNYHKAIPQKTYTEWFQCCFEYPLTISVVVIAVREVWWRYRSTVTGHHARTKYSWTLTIWDKSTCIDSHWRFNEAC